MQIAATYYICTEWQAAEDHIARAHVNSMRLHFNNTQFSLVAQASSKGTGNTLKDESKVAFVSDLGDCLLELGKKGNHFGKFSLTIVVYDRNPATVDSAVADFTKVFSRYSGSLYDESHNLLAAWFATQPGNHAMNNRRLWITSQNYADWSFLFTLDKGRRWNTHLDREALALLETADKTPYFLNLHQAVRDGNTEKNDDVAHTFITGRTGTGKSFLLNFLITSLQRYAPWTFIFDLGGSYRKLTELFEGTYVKIGVLNSDVTINPFILEPTKVNLEFLYAFIRVLIDSENDPLTVEDDKNLFRAIQNLYNIDADIRRLGTLASMLPRHLSDRLQKWVHGGQYGDVFDNERDTLTLTRFQCFDFEGMDTYPQLIEPLLFYVLHRASAVVNDPATNAVLKTFVLDEAWRFFKVAVIRQYLTEASKTWRKKNGVLIMATQSVEDLKHSGLINLIVESFPTKIFLANPDMDYSLYRETFHLNEKEMSLISTLVPKREGLLKTSTMAKKFLLEVDPESYWLYTNNPRDNELFAEAVREHGFDRALEVLSTRR